MSTIKFINCPSCNTQPLAVAVNRKTNAVEGWLRVRGGWCNLDSALLTVCPACGATLPAELPEQQPVTP